MLVGAALPWLWTSAGTTARPWLALFYTGVIVLAGALVPWRWAAFVQAVLGAVVGIGLPLWQVLRLLSRVGFSGWLPGPGLVMVLFAGVMCLICARQLLAEPA